MRLFTAIELPPEALFALDAYQERLKAKVSAKRWQPMAQAHLTVHFLGEVKEERLPDLEEALALTASASAPFRLSLSGLGAFPRPRAPKVLFVGVEGEKEKLLALEALGRDALLSRGFVLEERAYSPHVTLAREAAAFPVESDDLPAVDWPVERLVLFSSRLTPQGALHTALANFPLGKLRAAPEEA